MQSGAARQPTKASSVCGGACSGANVLACRFVRSDVDHRRTAAAAQARYELLGADNRWTCQACNEPIGEGGDAKYWCAEQSASQRAQAVAIGAPVVAIGAPAVFGTAVVRVVNTAGPAFSVGAAALAVGTASLVTNPSSKAAQPAGGGCQSVVSANAVAEISA